MHTLLLMRHAQAAPMAATDHDRPLTAYGRRQAHEMGLQLADRRIDLAMVSSARRTQQTFEELEVDCRVETMRVLYGCTVPTMRQRISESLDDEVNTLLVIAHSPAIPQLATQLSADPTDSQGQSMLCHYPPATLTEIAVDGPWREISEEFATSTSLRGVWEPPM